MQGAAREEELYHCLRLDEVRRTNHKSLTLTLTKLPTLTLTLP